MRTRTSGGVGGGGRPSPYPDWFIAGIGDMRLDNRAIGAQLATAVHFDLIGELAETLIERHQRLWTHLVGPTPQGLSSGTAWK
jgi:hypothetical protein